MAKFRKKPVVIEAMQFIGGKENAKAICEWCGFAAWYQENLDTITIDTLEGAMTASVGDWIIKGVQGEFYPCKPGIFQDTYEPVEQ